MQPEENNNQYQPTNNFDRVKIEPISEDLIQTTSTSSEQYHNEPLSNNVRSPIEQTQFNTPISPYSINTTKNIIQHNQINNETAAALPQAINTTIDKDMASSQLSVKKRFPLFIKISILLIIIGAGIFAAYHFLYPNQEITIENGKISTVIKSQEINDVVIGEKDLETTNAINTNFLKPKTYSSIPGQENIAKYQSLYADAGGVYPSLTITSYNTTTLSSYFNFNSATDSDIKSVRNGMTKSITSLDFNQVFDAGTIHCNSKTNNTITPDYTKTSTSIGLINIGVVCKRDTDEVILKGHYILGSDLISRSAYILATKISFERNGTVYDKIINSVRVQ